MSATRFIFVRHGETESNRRFVFRGRAEIPLNERGRRQAAAAGKSLVGIRVAAIYASPLGRTVETAQAIQKAIGCRKLVIEEGLNELDRGVWQGLTRAQAKRRYPKIYEAWYQHPAQASFPQGESLRGAQRRIRAAFDRIQRTCPRETAIVVSHTVVLRALLCSLLEISLNRLQSFDLSPASISKVDYEFGHYMIRSLNDCCHLVTLDEDSGAARRADSERCRNRRHPRFLS